MKGVINIMVMKKYIRIEKVLGKVNLIHGREWSGSYFLALDCKIKDGKHYPKYGIEYGKSEGKILYCKEFKYKKGEAIENCAPMSKPWLATDKVVTEIITAYNMVEPS